MSPGFRFSDQNQVDVPNLLDRFVKLQQDGLATAQQMSRELAKIDSHLQVLSERLANGLEQGSKDIQRLDKRVESVEQRTAILETFTSNLPTRQVIENLEKGVKSVEQFRWQAMAIIGAFTLVLTLFGDDLRSLFPHAERPDRPVYLQPTEPGEGSTKFKRFSE